MSKQPLRIAILGAGMRGHLFARILQDFRFLAKVAAVAEPREAYRTSFSAEFGIAPEMCFDTWQEFVEKRRDIDAVIITTMDRDHVGPAKACLEQGYHILLEKPVAPTLEECRQIESAARDSRAITAVCHSLRYQKGFRKLKDVVDEGRIGRIMTLDHIEQVAWWHQAHSYVRGNWRREDESAFMLLAKSCHDIDYIAYLVDRPCREIASFGELTWFTEENAPVGASQRCVDCSIEPRCPYSAVRFYLQTDREKFPAAVISHDHSFQGHLEALRHGPYGRCVWHSDNDVVDHQVVLMQFDEGITATFTMTAFAQQLGRRTRIHGTLGDLFFDQKTITIRTFGDNNTEVIQLGAEAGAHGGGDARVIQSWLNAIARNNPDLVLTSLPESLRTHTLVFAAEQARREHRIVRLEEMYAGSPRPNGDSIAIPASPSGGSNQGPTDSNAVWNSQL